MSNFTSNISPYVKKELSKSYEAQSIGDYSLAFTHLENAHVLGQESTYWHVKVHFLMMLWGIKQKETKETLGQIVRIIAAAILTPVNRLPSGNTGGSNVSPVKVMPINPSHAEIIAKAKGNT